MTSPPPPTTDLLASLAARQEITEVLYRYCRGCDRADEAALLTCFHPGSVHSHGAFQGLSEEFVELAMRVVRPLKACAHMVSNVMIELDGDHAVSECHFLAYHRRDKSDGPGEEDMFLKGRYLDRFERRDGAWRIVSRLGLHDFERFLEPADRTLASAPAEQLGGKWPDDPLYALLAAL